LLGRWEITTRLRPQIGHQSQLGFDEIRAELGCVFTPQPWDAIRIASVQTGLFGDRV
jgi:hypothetical protein